MKESLMFILKEYLHVGARFCVVYLLMLILLIFNMIFFYTPLSISIEAPLILMVVYYWSIYRPILLPPLLVFLTGLCVDLISGYPVGLSSFLFLISRQVISEQRLFLAGQPFLVIWLGFILLSLCIAFLQWFLFGLINFYWLSLMPTIISSLFGILFFPVIFVLLNLSHRILPDASDQYLVFK